MARPERVDPSYTASWTLSLAALAILLLSSSVQAQSDLVPHEGICSVYSNPNQTIANGGVLLSELRTLLDSGPDAYNYSAFGAPPTGQLGTAVTGAEALQFQTVAEAFIALQTPFLSVLASGNYTLNQFDDFKSLLSNHTAGYPPPYSLPFWQSDAFFGFTRKTVAAQYLTAASQKLPFDLTHVNVSGLLGGQTLESALGLGRLYVEDLSYPGSFPPSFFRPGRHAVDVVSLFFEDDEGDLLPIAISVANSAGVWTPNDAPYDWLLAKLYANTAAFLLEQTNHFFRQHIVPSSMRVAASNRLYASHPVGQMIQHYTQGDWGVSATGLQVVYQAKGGDYAWPYFENGTFAVLDLVKSNYNWTTDDLETNIAARGLSNLGNFPFLDDMRAHTAAIRNFTDAFVGLYYTGDSDVQGDSELQAWAGELAASGSVPGFQGSISSKDSLSGILTQMIRLVSVEHHLINTYAVYNYYTVPFFNRFMTAQPPASRGTVDAQTILQYIPTSPFDLSNLFSTAAFYRVVLQPQQTIVGALEVAPFEPCAAPAVEAYIQALQGIQNQIMAREDVTPAPFPFPLALPSILPYRAFD